MNKRLESMLHGPMGLHEMWLTQEEADIITNLVRSRTRNPPACRTVLITGMEHETEEQNLVCRLDTGHGGMHSNGTMTWREVGPML